MTRRRGATASRAAWLGDHWRVVAVVAAAFVVCGLLLALFLTRDAAIRQLRQELVSLRDQQRQAALEQDDLRQQLSASSEADVIEEQARERLGLVKPGEEKVIFVEE
jgi:cell division protein FtsB